MTQALHKDKERGLQTFLLALSMATLLFLPFIIWDKGLFIYYGDFNAQQIPFYQMAHDAVRSGDVFWSWTTDLGANFIGSFSFYLLGSPFFWLTLPFPSEAVPYLMGPLLILKFACAAWTAYLFCRRFVRPQYALLAGILYAFSGFSIYNVFFNHFHEAIIYFPLILWALERYMVEGKRGWFALTVCLSALSNYYFFIGQAVFLLLYFGIRLWSHGWEVKASRIIGLFFEAVVGTAMAGVLLLPSFFAVIQNSRTSRIIEGWDVLIYNTPQRLWDILHSFFFPQDIPAQPNFFPDANNKWSSTSAWLPLFGCVGGIAYIQSRKHTDWLRRMLFCCFFCAVIPVFNAVFQLFNETYYARWFYMMVLLLALATVRCFDGMHVEEGVEIAVPVDWRRAFFWAFGGTLFFTVILGLTPQSWEADEATGTLAIGLVEYSDRFWIYVAIALVGLIVAALLTKIHREHPRSFFRWATLSLCVVSLAYSWYFIGLGKAGASFSSDYIRERVIEGDEKISLPESEEWSRIDPYKDTDNLCMYWQMPGIQAFHSVVPGSIMEFYTSIGVQRSVASRPDTTHYALRSLLSVKWVLDYDNADGLFNKSAENAFEKEGKTLMKGWTYRDTQNGYRTYRNDNFLPMGFGYASYLPRSEYETLGEDRRELLLLKTLVVEDEQVEDVARVLPKYDLKDAQYTYAAFTQDVKERSAVTASTFTPSSRGFSAEATLTEPTLLFFSVPYEKGWSAVVNGEAVEIVRANVGFMAVECPAGEVTITFSYETPGLVVGICISTGAAALLGAYLLIGFRLKARRADQATATKESVREADASAFSQAEVSAPSEDVKTAPTGEHGEGFDLYRYYQPPQEDASE